jgi:hypothetical protein
MPPTFAEAADGGPRYHSNLCLLKDQAKDFRSVAIAVRLL